MSDEYRRSSISENTFVRLGLALIIGTYIGMSAWWASGISKDVRQILESSKLSSVEYTVLRSRIESLERASDLFTQVGSPALRPRIEALEKDVVLLKTHTSFDHKP